MVEESIPSVHRQEPAPWLKPILWGRARLTLAQPWPERLGPRVLRGSLLNALMPALPGGEHSDWTGRDQGESTLQRPAPICYRLHRGVPEIYMLGELAHDHLMALCRYLHHLPMTDGRRLEVAGVEVAHGTHEVTFSQHRWARYRTRTPIFPGAASWGRRPMPEVHLPTGTRWRGETEGALPLRAAWAARTLSRSILDRMAHYGLDIAQNSGVYVQVLRYEERPGLEWARPLREIRTVRAGFMAEFVTNADLPDGWPVGSKVSEGYGELERLDYLRGP